MVSTSIFGSERWWTLNDTMASWVGSEESQLIGSWGAPNATCQNRDGSIVATWKHVYTNPNTGNYGVCEQTVLIDSKGIVQKWKFGGFCETVIKKKSPISKDIPIPEMTL